MTHVLFDYIVTPAARIELNNYLTNVQRFLCTLNAVIFETEANDNFVSQQYWYFIYAPMLACLLDHFKSVKRIKEASLEELSAITGEAKARVIQLYFSNQK